jgi:dimeric dUTPase (all-alpha-NTP-PPase superfamily)
MLDRELLNKLQEKQQKLDDFIIEKKGIIDSNTLKARLRLKVALLAEIGELANELATFKHWKKSQETNISKCQEELIDCLHFFLSLTNKLGIDFEDWEKKDLNYIEHVSSNKSWNEFLESFFWRTCSLELRIDCNCDGCEERESKVDCYYYWLRTFEQIAFKLGLRTKEEIEKAYDDKNKENWDRQNEGY